MPKFINKTDENVFFACTSTGSTFKAKPDEVIEIDSQFTSLATANGLAVLAEPKAEVKTPPKAAAKPTGRKK